MPSDSAASPGPQPSGQRASVAALAIVRLLAVAVFGLLFPLFIAYGVSGRIDDAERFVQDATRHSYVIEQFEKNPERFRSGNDYALIALADSERANLAVMINKQVMKLVIIYMGFAVMSFSMMFIILGFTDGPVSATGSVSAVDFNLQFGSIGAAIFVLGAAMAAGGGLLRNEYQTVGLPGFLGGPTPAASDGGKLAEDIAICAMIKAKKEREECILSTASSQLE